MSTKAPPRPARPSATQLQCLKAAAATFSPRSHSSGRFSYAAHFPLTRPPFPTDISRLNLN
ncbi:hypothetical protein E2C01_000187 [Portunus trituberculatus]|uniref:Uncharacterized protein n=1 Tax=Portunus trituberculatus TaxID=210409 RepID=A0A5B7CIZ8_PORTR|nr:hypothetical protein [Portunus trituberculatus]